MRKRFLLLLLIFICGYNLQAQDLTTLWTGQRSAQKSETLPKGNAAPQTAIRVAPKDIPTRLVSNGDNEWIISDGWRLIDNNKLIESGKSPIDPALNVSDWYNATVPGTVLTTLVNQGVYPDPYFGLNNMFITDSLCRQEWWYQVKFDAPENSGDKNSTLLFNGINYRAVIYLNGKKIGNMDGAFKRGEFDVTGLIKKTGNTLNVHIYPPANPGIPHEQSMVAGQGLNGGMLSLDGPTFISSIGWDWIPGIRDRNIGIWQDVIIRTTGDVVIGDPLIVTNLPLPDTTTADIIIKTPIKNITNKPVSGSLRAVIENVQVEEPYTLAAGESKEIVLSPDKHKALTIQKPRLWWPNGYGSPELYNVKLSTVENGAVSDTKDVRFGIREMSYEMMVNTKEKGNVRVAYVPTDRKDNSKPLFNFIDRVNYTKDNQLPTIDEGSDMSGLQEIDANDPVGAFFVIRVNGVRIFCRGGNWGMDDGMKRVDRERLEPYFRLHKEANFNIIRNWTGESTEENFYALCDEYGMMVWNDFWITTDDTVEPNDFGLFMSNARDVVRRFRNHPSIAVWNPRNEGFAPEGMDVMLSEMMAEEDCTRHYHGQSRFLNMGTSGPWGYFKDPSKYYTQNAKGFNTEMGTFAVPTANTIRKFIAEEDLWPINDVWAYHDLHHKSQNFDDFIAAVNSYGKATGMEDFSRKAQIVCYDAWRNMLEAWNSKMWNNTSGLILWMTHPAWPSMIWQTYSYDYETPGAFFGAKKACEPLHVQMNLPDNDIAIINTTNKPYEGMSVSVSYYDMNGKQVYKESKPYTVAPNAMTKAFTPKKSDLPIYLARVELKDAKGGVVSVNDYLKTSDSGKNALLNDVNKAGVSYKMVTIKDKNYVELSNNSKNIALSVKLNATDKATGEIILPAYFSDGYINLLPGEKRKIEYEVPGKTDRDINILISGYNI